MKTTFSLHSLISGLFLVLIASGCQRTAAVQNGLTSAPPTATAEQVIAAPTENPDLLTSSPAPAALENGYVLFDAKNGAFDGYAADGSILFHAAAPGVTYPSQWTTSVVKDAVYYRADNTGQVMRSSASGVEAVNIPSTNLTNFAVSRDEKYIAWATMDPSNGDSELWVANRSGNDARQVASYTRTDPAKSEFLALQPLEWTADGSLLFDRRTTGAGGYILYSAHNSLNRYNPISGQIDLLIPADHEISLCLDSYRLDLEKAVFICGEQGPDLIIRDLRSQTMTTLPRLPEQGQVGSARYSPSGKWLAYAAAKGDPENESGQVIVVPADLSAAPTAIANAAEKSFPAINGWLDEDTLLFSRYGEGGATLWTVNVDGSDLKQVGVGAFIGWMR